MSLRTNPVKIMLQATILSLILWALLFFAYYSTTGLVQEVKNNVVPAIDTYYQRLEDIGK